MALSAFAVAKLHDPAVEALVVALLGATAAALAPADEITYTDALGNPISPAPDA